MGDKAQPPARELRIAYGGIAIECSTYSRLLTRMDEFTILRGAELTASARFQFLKRYPVSFMPTLVATAVPGGPIERKTYDAIKAEFLKRLEALMPLDGLYLPMHGAMFVEGMQDAEADWYRAARKVVGPACLMSASYDLHGNISQPIIDTLDMLSAFRTAPHIDREETMLRATDMLVHCLQEKIRPTLMWAPIPVLMPGERSSTEWEPGKRLWAQLPALNRESGILDVSMLVGYVWADEPRSTAAVVVTGTAPNAERRVATDLAQQYWDARAEFQFGTETCTLEECVQRAIDAKTQPAILADSGDNPTAGGNGDQATVLESLLRHKARNVVFAGIADRAATEACYKAGVGTRVSLSIGATLDPKASQPVKTEAVVKFLLDGIKSSSPRSRGADPGCDAGAERVSPSLPRHRGLHPTRTRSEEFQDHRREVRLSFAGTRAHRQPEPHGADRWLGQPGHRPPAREPVPQAELPVRREPQLHAEGLWLRAESILTALTNRLR